MFATPSMGDVLLLSHTSKSIGQIFGTHAPGVPQDFFEVERETQGLADALKLLAYTLEADSTIAQSAQNVQESIYAILASAQITLQDLAAFVESYSTTQRAVPISTRAQQSWRPDVLRDWRSLPWTRNNGDIISLRSMLIMHCHTIHLVTQALHDRSAERLASTVVPLARKLEEIYNDTPERLDVRLDELHHITTTVANPPRLSLEWDPEVRQPLPDHRSGTQASTPNGHTNFSPISLPSPTFGSSRGSVSPEASPVTPAQHYHYTDLAQPDMTRQQHSWNFSSHSEQHLLHNQSSFSSKRQPQHAATWPIQSTPDQSIDGDLKSVSPRHESLDHTQPSTSKLSTKNSAAFLPKVPQPNATSSPVMIAEAVPFSALGITESPRRSLDSPTLPPAFRPGLAGSSAQSESTMSDLPLDESTMELFNDKAQLAEILPPELQDPSQQQMNDSTVSFKDCRIIIAKTIPGLGPVHRTSTISLRIMDNAGSVRFEQTLPATRDCSVTSLLSFGSPHEVLMTIHVKIKHSPATSDSVHKTHILEQTLERLEYTFESLALAARFESAVNGYNLLDTFCIEKATVIRDSGSKKQVLRNILGPEERLCNRQRLRLWLDKSDSAYGSSSGGILARTHLHPELGAGYLQWWVNTNPNVSVKGRSRNVVEIRGMDCSVSKPLSRSSRRQDSAYSAPPTPASRAPVNGNGRTKASSDRPRPSHDDPLRFNLSRTPSVSTMASSYSKRSSGTRQSGRTFREASAHTKRDKAQPEDQSHRRQRSGSVSPLPADEDSFPLSPHMLERQTTVSPPLSTNNSYYRPFPGSLPTSPTSPVLSDLQWRTKVLPPLPQSPHASTLAMSTPGGKWNTPVYPRSRPDTTSKPELNKRPPPSLAPTVTPQKQPQTSFLNKDPLPSPRPPKSDMQLRSATHSSQRQADSISVISARSNKTAKSKRIVRKQPSVPDAPLEAKPSKAESDEGKINVVKLYFSTSEDKDGFLAAVARARSRLLDLPDL